MSTRKTSFQDICRNQRKTSVICFMAQLLFIIYLWWRGCISAVLSSWPSYSPSLKRESPPSFDISVWGGLKAQHCCIFLFYLFIWFIFFHLASNVYNHSTSQFQKDDVIHKNTNKQNKTQLLSVVFRRIVIMLFASKISHKSLDRLKKIKKYLDVGWLAFRASLVKHDCHGYFNLANYEPVNFTDSELKQFKVAGSHPQL